MPYPAAEVSGMKDPKPPTLLRLKPIIANARYQDASNLEGLETVIPDGAPTCLDDYLTRIIRELVTNDSQWCKVGCESW